MSNPKKDGHFINCYLDRNLYERLCYYAEEKGQTKTLAIERILKQYFDEHDIPDASAPTLHSSPVTDSLSTE